MVPQHLKGYSGIINLETIGGRIIEAHLRFADQWPDLYGEGWVEALVRLYARRRMAVRRYSARTGYSVVLFAPPAPLPPSPASLQAIRQPPGVSSLQITFHEDLAPAGTPCRPAAFVSPSSIAGIVPRERCPRTAARVLQITGRHDSQLEVAPQEAGEQADDEQHQRNDEKYLRHASRRRGNPAEAEHRGHQRDHEVNISAQYNIS